MTEDPRHDPAVNEPDDIVLSTLVQMVDSGTISDMSITVNVAGAVITGDLLSRDAWFESLISATQSDVAQKMFATILESLQKADERDSEDEGRRSRRNALHVRGQLLAGESLSGADGHWRCEFSQIASWSPGKTTRRA